MAVSTTTAALDACFCWDPGFYKEVQLRVLSLRGVTAATAQACREGRPISLRKKPLNLTTPVPWSRHPWMGNLPKQGVEDSCAAKKSHVSGRRPFAAYCPWAACLGVTETTVPDLLDLPAARKAQITCKACGARFAAARAWCAVCRLPPHLCGGHALHAPREPPPPGRRPGAFAGVGALKAAMARPAAGLDDRTGDGVMEEGKAQEARPGRATDSKQLSLSTLWGQGRINPSDRVCAYSYQCTGCRCSNDLSALSTDPKGYLRPVRCKACGMAARPTAARCNTCRTTWQTCVSKPTPGAGSAIRSAIRASREWVIPYATDFSGMGMTSFAMDRVLLGDIGSEQRWASDIWDQARAFCSTNHAPKVIYGDTRHKPMPGPPIAIYVAGPP